MILDTIENSRRYSNLNSKFEKAFRFLKEGNVENLEVGKYEIDGDDVFALVQAYTPGLLEASRWEAHKKYIDIQYVVSGREINAWTPVAGLTVAEDILQDKDVAFYGETGMWTEARMSDGCFAIFFPEDAHKPGRVWDVSREVKKVVVKIKE